jgi:quaternary ammonium compound-resistance protein SugE
VAWFALFVAGLLEVVWAVGLKYSEGFRRPLASALTLVAMVASMLLLARAVRDLPVGTAYAVWVGIGALGTALWGLLIFHEPASWARLLFLGLLLVSIVGLKLTTPG